MKNILWVIAIIVAFVLGYGVGGHYSHTVDYIEHSDTITITDTIRDTIPQPVKIQVIKHDTVPDLKVIYDTITKTEKVILPKIQKEYQDTTHHLWISGYYDVNLDSAYFFPKTKIITNTVVKTKSQRWGLGVQIGAGYNGKFTPYIGVGVQYNIFSW